MSHWIQKIAEDHYRLHWTYDVKIRRIRWPRTITRDTDLAGAMRFAKKWSLGDFPRTSDKSPESTGSLSG